MGIGQKRDLRRQSELQAEASQLQRRQIEAAEFVRAATWGEPLPAHVLVSWHGQPDPVPVPLPAR